MTNIAYSYLRFSTPEQAAGDSRRRQIAMAEAYAAKHRLTLDRQLSFRDLGISAFRSENAKEGKLRAFLEAIEHNLVPEGSVLLIESLDRLSRDRILSAQALFMQIIQAGVTLVTLIDQRSYSLESINRNPLDLIVSLVTMMRANDESETKSQRIKAVFDVKRSQLSVRPWSARCPGWLRLNKTTSKFEVVQERADLVRRIFRLRLTGVSQQSIVRQLNEERVPLFGHGNQRGKMWQKALVRHLLYTPTVVGTLVPFTTEWVDGIRRLRPQTPVEGYYPAIIDREDWDKIQASRAAWAAHYRCNLPKTGRANLLAGLARCPFCDARLVLFGAGHENWRYYICRKAYNAIGCSDHWIRYPGIEVALTIDIREVINSCPKPILTSDARRHRLRYIRMRLGTLRERQRSMQAETGILAQTLRPRVIAREAVQNEIDKLLAERKRLRIDRPKWLDLTLTKRLNHLRAVATAPDFDRKELHAVFCSLFSKVVVDWQKERLIFHWQHGGESSVGAMMKPQRKVANPRRSDRPRFAPGQMAMPMPVVAR